MTATDDDIAKLEEALAKATPGPWREKTTGNLANTIEAYSGRKSWDGDDGFRCVASFQACEATDNRYAVEANCAANGAAIVAAVNLAPALIARLRAAEAERDAHMNPFWAVSYLYVHGYLTDRERDACRKRILSRIQKEASDGG